MIHDFLGPKGGEDAPDFTTCMFCGDHDNKWNEDALDLHYWKVRTWYDMTAQYDSTVRPKTPLQLNSVY